MIQWASEADAAAAVAIWREAAAWLHAMGQPLWDAAAFDEPSARAAARAGELVVGRSSAGGEPVACMRLTTHDPVFWPGEPAGAALYVHKLAVARAHAGAGWARALLDWAAERAAPAVGAHAVRLDCAPRPPLVRLYQECGFQAVDPAPVTRGGHVVWRFERRISPDAARV